MRINSLRMAKWLTSFVAISIMTSCSKDDEPKSLYFDAIFPNGHTFSGLGEEFDITIESNCDWIFQEKAHIIFEPSSGGAGSTTVHVKTPKSSKKSITQGTISIRYYDENQADYFYDDIEIMGYPYLISEPQWYTFDAEGGIAKFKIRGNTYIPEIEIPEEYNWISVQKGFRYKDVWGNDWVEYWDPWEGESSSVIEIKCSSNYSNEARFGYILIHCTDDLTPAEVKIEISQYPHNP